MVLLKHLNGKEAGTEISARRFPFSIGRSPNSNYRLMADGVWDHHAEIHLHRSRDFVLVAKDDASVLLNGHPVTQAVLRNGDHVHLGGAQLLFSLSPPTPRSLKLRETFTWMALGALFVLQLALIYWLVD